MNDNSRNIDVNDFDNNFNFETRTVTLNSGYEMPILGLGTWTQNNEETANCFQCCRDASAYAGSANYDFPFYLDGTWFSQDEKRAVCRPVEMASRNSPLEQLRGRI